MCVSLAFDFATGEVADMNKLYTSSEKVSVLKAMRKYHEAIQRQEIGDFLKEPGLNNMPESLQVSFLDWMKTEDVEVLDRIFVVPGRYYPFPPTHTHTTPCCVTVESWCIASASLSL